MADTDGDWDLLQQYVRDGSTDALTELTIRHLPMVNAVATRQLNDPHLAEEVAQVVFMVLMKRASRISADVVLSGWLFNVTRLTGMRIRRSRWRRLKHERTAAGLRANEAAGRASHDPCGDYMPLVDSAIARLPCVDRDAVILRFFQGKSFREVGQIQRVTENAARQRIFRAVGKLRSQLATAGVALSADAVTTTLTATATSPPPAQVASRVLKALHSSRSAVGTAVSAETILKVMFMTKVKTAAIPFIIGLLLLTIGGGIYLGYPHKSARDVILPPVDSNSPNATFLKMLDAVHDGNVEAMVALFEPLSRDGEATLRKLASGFEAAAQLRSTVSARFGKPAAEQLMQQLRIDPPVASRTELLQIPATVTGDKAQLQIAQIGTIPFKQVRGTWKLAAEMLDQQVGRVLAEMADAAPELKRIRGELIAGQYTSLQPLRLELQKLAKGLSNKDPVKSPAQPSVLGPGPTPKETLAAYYWALVSGNEEAALSLLHNPSPAQAVAVKRMVKLYSAGERIRVAAADRFGHAVARDAVLTLGLDPGINNTLLESATEKVAGDTATVDLASIGLMEFVRVNNAWLFAPKEANSPNSAWHDRLIDHYLPMDLQLAADIQAGRYASASQLRSAVNKMHDELKQDRERFAITVAK
ncbi:MAG TPA: sigma-70 family RNA polymerase sigma factor [Tepidisphaeraceae bacterium]